MYMYSYTFSDKQSYLIEPCFISYMKSIVCNYLHRFCSLYTNTIPVSLPYKSPCNSNPPTPHFGTDGITADTLYPIVWEAVRLLKIDGLKVICVQMETVPTENSLRCIT